MQLVVTLSPCCGRCDDESSIDGNLIVEHEIVFISNVKGGPKGQKSISAEVSSAATLLTSAMNIVEFHSEAYEIQ